MDSHELSLFSKEFVARKHFMSSSVKSLHLLSLPLLSKSCLPKSTRIGKQDFERRGNRMEDNDERKHYDYARSSNK